MSLTIQTNLAALEAERQLTISSNSMDQSLERLSSGFRINHASDDAAGLSMSNKFVAQIDAMTVAQQNTSQANALLQIAEGGADQISQILARMKELATEANSANANSNTGDIEQEALQLQAEITRIANSTTFQGSSLLNGTWGQGVGAAGSTTATVSAVNYIYGFNYSNASQGTYSVSTDTVTGTTLTIKDMDTGVQQTLSITTAGTFNYSGLGISFSLATGVTGSVFIASFIAAQVVAGTFSVAAGVNGGSGGNTFQIGETNGANYQFQVSLGNVTASALLVDSASLTLNNGGAAAAMTAIDCAINTLNTQLANFGAYMDRLNYASSNLSVAIENANAANSAVKDVNMASEMTNFTKNQVLVQAGTAMLAQANASVQNILTLFK